MKARLLDNSTHEFLVSSESEHEKDYRVLLGIFPIGKNEDGVMLYNGCCGPDPAMQTGCKDFRYRCLPNLRKPENEGKIFRCKHIRCAREFALDYILPILVKYDPNLPDTHQI